MSVRENKVDRRDAVRRGKRAAADALEALVRCSAELKRIKEALARPQREAERLCRESEARLLRMIAKLLVTRQR